MQQVGLCFWYSNPFMWWAWSWYEHFLDALAWDDSGCPISGLKWTDKCILLKIRASTVSDWHSMRKVKLRDQSSWVRILRSLIMKGSNIQHMNGLGHQKDSQHVQFVGWRRWFNWILNIRLCCICCLLLFVFISELFKFIDWFIDLCFFLCRDLYATYIVESLRR